MNIILSYIYLPFLSLGFKGCGEDALKDSIVTTDPLPYTANTDFLTLPEANGNYPFTITSFQRPPVVTISAKVNMV